MKTAHCALLTCWLAFSVSGCGSSSPVRYFSLEPAGPPAVTAGADAMIVGIGEELSLLVLSASYKSAVGFFAIVLVLTLRPRGLLGERAF